MSEAPRCALRAAGASSVLRNVFRALPCRVPAATWQSGHPEWTAAWLRAGAENLNGWVPMLGAQVLLVMITLGLEWWLRSDVWPTGKCVPVWRRIVGCSFRLGLFGKLRDGILLYCGSHFPQRASTGKRVPEFAIKMGWSFHRPPARKKASGAVALEAFRLHANGCASYSWLDARRHGRSCIPRQWG